MTPLLKDSQQVYRVNCPECGGIAKVVNPLLNRSPCKVTVTGWTGSDLRRWEFHSEPTFCSECRARLHVYFFYDRSNDSSDDSSYNW